MLERQAKSYRGFTFFPEILLDLPIFQESLYRFDEFVEIVHVFLQNRVSYNIIDLAVSMATIFLELSSF
jgi:hypothetical protein